MSKIKFKLGFFDGLQLSPTKGLGADPDYVLGYRQGQEALCKLWLAMGKPGNGFWLAKEERALDEIYAYWESLGVSKPFDVWFMEQGNKLYKELN